MEEPKPELTLTMHACFTDSPPPELVPSSRVLPRLSFRLYVVDSSSLFPKHMLFRHFAVVLLVHTRAKTQNVFDWTISDHKQVNPINFPYIYIYIIDSITFSISGIS